MSLRALRGVGQRGPSTVHGRAVRVVSDSLWSVGPSLLLALHPVFTLRDLFLEGLTSVG